MPDDFFEQMQKAVEAREPVINRLCGGTWYTVDYARKVKKPAVIFPDGTLLDDRPYHAQATITEGR